MDDLEHLRPTLDEAAATLKASLAQACGTDPDRANTGELIRLEEVLSIASDAAKRAVSVRRRLRQSRRGSTPAGGVPAPEVPAPEEPRQRVRIQPALVHRQFADARGTAWTVWSVFPEKRSQASLQGSYAQGWLTFECAEERRRLSPIPDNWQQLDQAGLAALCDVAARVPRRS